MRSLVVLFVLIAQNAALARMIQIPSLDEDVPKCDAIFIAKIKGITNEGMVDVKGEMLDSLSVAATVEFPIHAAVVQGQDLIFRHFRWNISLKRWCKNCYSSFNFQLNESYLLFLKKDENGEYSLLHMEELDIIRVSDQMMRAVRSAAPREDLAEYILDIVWAVLEIQTDECSATLKILSNSRKFARRLDNPEIRMKFTDKLRQLTQAAKDGNTLGTAYGNLARLGDTPIIPRLIHFIVKGQGSSIQKTNAINWLSGFPSDEQVKALKIIIQSSKDEPVLHYARMKLKDPTYSQSIGE